MKSLKIIIITIKNIEIPALQQLSSQTEKQLSLSFDVLQPDAASCSLCRSYLDCAQIKKRVHKWKHVVMSELHFVLIDMIRSRLVPFPKDSYSRTWPELFEIWRRRIVSFKIEHLLLHFFALFLYLSQSTDEKVMQKHKTCDASLCRAVKK